MLTVYMLCQAIDELLGKFINKSFSWWQSSTRLCPKLQLHRPAFFSCNDDAISYKQFYRWHTVVAARVTKSGVILSQNQLIEFLLFFVLKKFQLSHHLLEGRYTRFSLCAGDSTIMFRKKLHHHCKQKNCLCSCGFIFMVGKRKQVGSSIHIMNGQSMNLKGKWHSVIIKTILLRLETVTTTLSLSSVNCSEYWLCKYSLMITT